MSDAQADKMEADLEREMMEAAAQQPQGGDDPTRISEMWIRRGSV